jgi:hypothetical protein
VVQYSERRHTNRVQYLKQRFCFSRVFGYDDWTSAIEAINLTLYLRSPRPRDLSKNREAQAEHSSFYVMTSAEKRLVPSSIRLGAIGVAFENYGEDLLVVDSRVHVLDPDCRVAANYSS